VLKPGGMLCWLNAAPRHAVARSDVKIVATEVRASRERLGALLAMLASKEIRAPVESRFALERGADAYELSRGGHARGKIVLQMS
jgi:NADPH:quinone reductase-like Zn-dependent oxidoreductase